jgi:hypothetical protein
MDPPPFIVFDGIRLPDFIQHVLGKHTGPSTLIVCGTKAGFLEQLQASHRQMPSEHNPSQATQDVPPQSRTAAWSAPTLRQLAASRTVKLAFCPDITHLRAYLATYATRLQKDAGGISKADTPEKRILAILNPITLHRPTSAYSAQGLNRTFSAAVEAAHHTASHLLIAECPANASHSVFGEAIATDPYDEEPTLQPQQNVWDEEVSILNVTTKSFGVGDRGWVGRTVKLRTIAERWCVFQYHAQTSADG